MTKISNSTYSSYNDFINKNIGEKKIVISVGSGGTSQPFEGATKESLEKVFKDMIFHEFKDSNFSSNYNPDEYKKEYFDFINKFYNELITSDKAFVDFWSTYMMNSGHYDSKYSIVNPHYTREGKSVDYKDLEHYPDSIFYKYKNEMSSGLKDAYVKYMKEYADEDINLDKDIENDKKYEWNLIRHFDDSEFGGKEDAEERADKYIKEHVEYWKGSVKEDDLKKTYDPKGATDWKGVWNIFKKERVYEPVVIDAPKKNIVDVVKIIEPVKKENSEMNNIISNLKKQGISVRFEDERGRESDFNNAATYYVFSFDRALHINGSMPKRESFTEEYVLRKIAEKEKYEYIDYSKIFKNLNLPNVGYYTTTYGVGVEVIFGNKKETIETISNYLKENGIEFTNEYSDAGWAYRFKISKSKSNLDKIKSLIENKGEMKQDKLTEGRKKAYLQRDIKYNGKVMTHKEWLDTLIKEGRKPIIKEVVDTAKKNQILNDWEHIKNIYPFGNTSHPQTIKALELKKIIKDESFPKKNEYRAMGDDGSFSVLEKFGYEYMLDALSDNKEKTDDSDVYAYMKDRENMKKFYELSKGKVWGITDDITDYVFNYFNSIKKDDHPLVYSVGIDEEGDYNVAVGFIDDEVIVIGDKDNSKIKSGNKVFKSLEEAVTYLDELVEIHNIPDDYTDEAKAKIKELKGMGIANAEELYNESLAKTEKEKVTPTLRKKLNKYINEAINIKTSNVKEVSIDDKELDTELRKKYGEFPEGLLVDIDGDNLFYLKFNSRVDLFEISATVYPKNTKKVESTSLSDLNKNIFLVRKVSPKKYRLLEGLYEWQNEIFKDSEYAKLLSKESEIIDSLNKSGLFISFLEGLGLVVIADVDKQASQLLINLKFGEVGLSEDGIKAFKEKGYDIVVEKNKEEMTKHLDYKKAIQLPKGGAVAMDKDNFTAQAAEMISAKQGTRPEAIYNWANKHDVDLVKYGYILADIKSNDELLEDVLNDKFDAVKMLIEKKENERFVKQKEGTKVIVKSINDKGEPKYKKGDSVGYKSDSDFTKSNKDRPAMTVVSSKWNDKNKNWEYILKGTVGAETEYGLEPRENVSLTEKKSDLDMSKKLTRKERRAEIAKDYDLTEEEVNEFMRISSVIKFHDKPTEIKDTSFANALLSKDLVLKENGKYFLTDKGTELAKIYFNINDNEEEIYDLGFEEYKTTTFISPKGSKVVLSSNFYPNNKKLKYALFINDAPDAKFGSKEDFDEAFDKLESSYISKGYKKDGVDIVEKSDLEKAKEEYPIVLEWSEGLDKKNVGFDYFDGLERALHAAGVSETPNDSVIKNKVWFKGYPHFIYIENGLDEKDGNYNPETKNIEKWLKVYDPKFNWSIYENGNDYGFEVKEYTPQSKFNAGDLVRFNTSNFDDEEVDIDSIDVAFDNHYGYVVKANKYVRDSKRWKPYWSYAVKDKFDDSIIYDNVMESRISKVTEEKINKEVTDAKIEEGSAELLTKEEAEKLSEKYIELLKGEYNQKNDTLHDWFGEVISRYPKMLSEWQNIQLDYLPKKEQELLEYFYNEGLPNLKQFFNSLMKYNVGKKELIGLYELISERLVNHTLPKKIDFKLDPKDKNLGNIFKKIVSDDDLRIKLTGVNFDERGVVATDANKMLFIKGKVTEKGIFKIGSELGVEIVGEKYPNWNSVIPKQATDIISVDRKKVEGIVTSLRTIKNAKYFNSSNPIITVSLYKGEGMHYNVYYLIDLLEAWLKIGFEKLDFSYRTKEDGKNVTMLISPDIKKWISSGESISILMAVMINKGDSPSQFTIPQTGMYIDITTGKAETAGITDDLYSELNLALGTTGAIEEKEQIEELESLIELLKEVVTENPKDLDSSDALELYEETLVGLKKVNSDKFAQGGKVGCGCMHSFKNGGKIKDNSGNLNSYTTGIYLTMYETDLPDGTIVGDDADWGQVVAYKGKVVSMDKLPEGMKVIKKFEEGGYIENTHTSIIPNLLIELWLAVHEKRTDDYGSISEKLDANKVPFSVQNKVSESATELRYKKAIDVLEVKDRVGSILTDYLNKEAEDILRVGKIETDIRDEKNNTRTMIVEIKPYKEYALIVKKNGNVIKLAKGQNELSLLLNKDKFENGGGIGGEVPEKNESIIVKNLLDSHRSEIEKQLGYLVNVAKRLKLSPPTWEFSEVYEHEFTIILGTYGSGEDAENDCETYIEKCFDVTLHVSETLKISGDWVFACSIDHRASSMIQVYEDTIIPLKYNPSNDYCEHCNKRYPRVKSYVVLNKSNNEFKQVGKGCLKQFLGINPASYITMFEAISKFSPFVQGYGRKNTGGRLVDLAYNVQDMLRYTIHQVSKDNGVFTKSLWKEIVDGHNWRGDEIHKNIRTNQGESTIDKVKIRLDAIGFFRMNPNLLNDKTTVEQLEERIKFYSMRLSLYDNQFDGNKNKFLPDNQNIETPAFKRYLDIRNLIYSTKQHLHAVKYRMLLNENILDYNEEYESIKLFANNLAIAQEGEKDYNSSFDQYKQLLKTVFLKARTLQSNLKTIVSGYNFYVTQTERDKQNAIRKANAEFLTHIGTVGEKSEFILKIISYKEGEGAWGTWKLWGMEDESGNKFSKFGEIPKKFTTIENEQTESNDVSIGSTISVTAMIKEHKVFREEKITVLGILSKTKGANYIYEVKKEPKPKTPKLENGGSVNLSNMKYKKGDVVLFKCGDNDTGCRGEVLDVISEDEFLVSKGIKSMMVAKDKIVGIAPAKINTIFERDFSIYDERVLGINSTKFYLAYTVGNNPFEVNYDASNEYGYGIYAYDSKDSSRMNVSENSRVIKLVPNVKKPLIFLNDDGSSFNSQYKDAYENAVKYDGVTNKDEFNRKMVEMGYDSMLVSDIHGLHLILFYNDPNLYTIKSDLASN